VGMTRDFKKTLKERAMHDSAFAKALIDESAMLGSNGERHAEHRLRNLVTASAAH
jgi:hypothetical protein